MATKKKETREERIGPALKEIKCWVGNSTTKSYIQVWVDRSRGPCTYVTTPDDSVIRLSPENARELAEALIQTVES